MKILGKLYMALVILFLYAPIAVMIVFSFNSGSSVWVFEGFSLDWYAELIFNSEMLEALKHTLIIAILSATVSTVLGTAAAVGITALKNKFAKSALMSITNIPMMNADIVTGVSLMLLFIALNIPRGMFTMLLAHITFNIPYVILSVTPKLISLDSNLYEAAIDLGAKPWYAFKNVVMPEIMPGIITGLLLAFTLSIDDFVISFFTTGNGVSNLSIYVYSTAKRLNPKINALSTVMFLFIILMLYIINRRSSKDKDNNVLMN
jgi:spermidine/putrescine transport system permease protein